MRGVSSLISVFIRSGSARESSFASEFHHKGLQVFRSHDGAHAASPEGMMGFVEDTGEGNHVFTGRSDYQRR